jgi:hypothetical protein
LYLALGRFLHSAFVSGWLWGAYQLAINRLWGGFDVALMWLWGGFARLFCIHHSSFLILHSPQGTLDILWACSGTIEPSQNPVFDQPSLSNSLSCGISRV